MSFSTLFPPERKTSSAEPLTRSFITPEETDANGKRLLEALEWNDSPTDFSLENLNREALEIITRQTNSATIHYSANCNGLALALFYNLKIGSTVLALSNTSPFYRSLWGDSLSQIILGKSLNQVAETKNVQELEAVILANFKKTQERVFMLMIPQENHSLNAVVIGSAENSSVLFADAWHRRCATAAELNKTYAKPACSCILAGVWGNLIPLHSPPAQPLEKKRECGF